jgi:hypothetical protein
MSLFGPTRRAPALRPRSGCDLGNLCRYWLPSDRRRCARDVRRRRLRTRLRHRGDGCA